MSLSDDDREALRSALDGRCGQCLRPMATVTDWNSTGDEGERPDLCWETPYACGWVPEVSADDLRASVVEQIVDRHVAEARAAALNEAAEALLAQSWEGPADAARIVRNLATNSPP